MVDEAQHEEKSGFAASVVSPGKKEQEVSKREEDPIDTYGDDFEEDFGDNEIEEDLPVDQLLDSNENIARPGGGAGDSGGIAMS